MQLSFITSIFFANLFVVISVTIRLIKAGLAVVNILIDTKVKL